MNINLYHNTLTDCSVMVYLYFINGTPIDWYSKKQVTIETVTYGSEFIVSRTCVEQIMDLRTILRYLSVPVKEKSYMFGNNQSVINSLSDLYTKLYYFLSCS